MIALIHGSTCGASYSIFAKPRLNGDFGAWNKPLQAGQAKLFWWAKSADQLNFWQCLNPKKLINIYRVDKRYVQTELAQAKLSQFLKEVQPQIIIAHSAGCDYLLTFLQTAWKQEKNLNANLSVLSQIRQIHLISSDWQLANIAWPQTVIDKIQSGELIIYNHFCPWDNTLWISALLNWRWPDGLWGSHNTLVKNQFFWPRFPNFHTSLPNNPEFTKKVLETVSNKN